MSKRSCVLDASALLALLNQEAGCDIVLQHLTQSTMSTVNVAEVLTKLLDQGIPEHQGRVILENLNLKVLSFDYEHALICSHLRTLTKTHGLSLGDRACLATGKQLQLPVLTADAAWSKIKGLAIEVILIR